MITLHTRRLGALLLLALLLSACGPVAGPAIPTSGLPTQAPAPTEAPTDTAVPAANATPGPVTITDAAGRQVSFAHAPQRIVSLAPSNTEIVFALALRPQVVAVDDFSDYPAEVKQLPKIGGSDGKYNIEQVVALKPDLVLASGITPPEQIKQLEGLKLPVVVLGSADTTFDSIMFDINLVGTITGTKAQASVVTAAMQQKIQAITAKVAQAASKPRVYWELDATDASKPFTVGPGNFVHELITLAGGVNVFSSASSPYPQVSAEQVVATDPEVILMADAGYGTTVESLLARPGWGGISAVQHKQVYPIDGNLVSRPGPRIGDGLEAAAKLIHPEAFK